MIRERRVFHPERGWGTVEDTNVTSLQMRGVQLARVRFDDGTSDSTPAASLHYGPLPRAKLLDTLMVWAGGSVGWSVNDA